MTTFNDGIGVVFAINCQINSYNGSVSMMIVRNDVTIKNIIAGIKKV